MNAYQVMKHCKRLGFEFALDANKDLLITAEETLNPTWVQLIRQHKAAIVEYLETGSKLALIPDDESLWTSYDRWAEQQIKSLIALKKTRNADDTEQQEQTTHDKQRHTPSQPEQQRLIERNSGRSAFRD